MDDLSSTKPTNSVNEKVTLTSTGIPPPAVLTSDEWKREFAGRGRKAYFKTQKFKADLAKTGGRKSHTPQYKALLTSVQWKNMAASLMLSGPR
jgi:hypothetical protein